jgi:hypothetical protein
MIATSGSPAQPSGWRPSISSACEDPRTEAAIRDRVDQILAQHRAEEWVTVDIKWDAVEHIKAITRGKPTAETTFRRIVKKEPRLHVSTNSANIARSRAMDGIFPLTTNTKGKPAEVFKIKGHR